MLLLELEITGDEATRRSLEGIVRATRGDRLREPWERAVDLISMAVWNYAPYWRGELRASIAEEVIVEGDEIAGVVYSDLFFAPFQERGTAPYWPNVEALWAWADAHDISPYLVARAIANRGLLPLKFFERALTENENEVWALIDNAIAEIIEAEY